MGTELTLKKVRLLAGKVLADDRLPDSRLATVAEVLGEAVGNATPEGLRAALLKLEAALLGPEIVSFRDKFFKEASISPAADRVAWILNDGVDFEHVLIEIGKLNRKIHGISLYPAQSMLNKMGDYDDSCAAVTLSIRNSAFTGPRRSLVLESSADQKLANSRVSALALNLLLLLSADHPFKNSRELKNADGVLYLSNMGVELLLK